MNKVITISRECGSGGRELGRRLSELLHIAYYDQEILTEIAKRTELAESYIEQVVEQTPMMSFPIHVGRSFYPMMNPALELTQAVMVEQHKTIYEMAEKSDCVIVGRCGDYILRDFKPFRIFVYADLESRIQRCLERQTETEHYTREELKHKIVSLDKNRKKYYEFYTGKKWGDKINYDLCINTTNVSIKEIAGSFSKLFM